MDSRFGSIALLTLVLTYPNGGAASIDDEEREVQDIFGVYQETLHRLIADDIAALYSAYNDLTECISKLTIKIHASGLNTSGNSGQCLMLNADYKKAIHDLLQVSAALLARISLSLTPTSGSVDRAFKRARHVWPPRRLAERQAALEAAMTIWRLNVNEPYTKNLKIKKIAAELNNSLAYLWSICDKLLSCHTTPSDELGRPHQIKATIQWKADVDLIGVSQDDAQSIMNDLEKLADAQNQISQKVTESSDLLHTMEHTNANTADYTQQAVDQLAQASKLQTSKWPFTFAAVGAAVGSAIGLIGGPPGILIGASAGGALGGSAGKALQTRHHEVVTQVARRASFPSNLQNAPSGLADDLDGSPDSLKNPILDQQIISQKDSPSTRRPFSPNIREGSNRAVYLGCHSMPVFIERPRFQNS